MALLLVINTLPYEVQRPIFLCRTTVTHAVGFERWNRIFYQLEKLFSFLCLLRVGIIAKSNVKIQRYVTYVAMENRTLEYRTHRRIVA